ncbi:MAG: precorrin-6A/cobalt-precorrin-6A reductase [Pseudomonadota bacterium]
MPRAGSPLRVLLLAGTMEARLLQERLGSRPGIDLITALAGATDDPVTEADRTGGFGGKDGLQDYLLQQVIDLVIDATHPFAAQITSNAFAATQALGCGYLRLDRPAWTPVEGDQWITDPTRLSDFGACVLVTTGERGFWQLERHDSQTYIVRSISASTRHLPFNVRWLVARPPFSLASEIALMSTRLIEVVVAKNSGGSGGYSKIEAARQLSLPLLMFQRPAVSVDPVVVSISEALDWVDRFFGRRT